MLMEIWSNVKKNIKVFNTTCAHYSSIITGNVKAILSVFMEKYVGFVFPALSLI
jgi:hypothetical protein